MGLISRMRARVNHRKHTASPPPPHPARIVFRAGRYETCLPFDNPADDETGWQYVLDITSIGFRADRIGTAIYITGSPSADICEGRPS